MNPRYRIPYMTLCAMLVAVFSFSALAIGVEKTLTDPVLEARAKSLFKEIRCVVCVGESLSESQADLAKDLRRVIRVRIEKGESDEAVRQYLISRYGQEILMRPPFVPETYILWLVPSMVLALGLVILLSNRGEGTSKKLTAAKKRLKQSPAKKRKR